MYGYDPASDSCGPGVSASTPPPVDRFEAAVGFDGNSSYVVGGPSSGGERAEVYEFDSVVSRWISRPSGPSVRSAAFGVWDGAGFIVWSARGTASRSPTARTGSSIARSRRAARAPAGGAPPSHAPPFGDRGWAARVANGQTLIMGGSGASGHATDGALYDATAGSWTRVPVRRRSSVWLRRLER